MKRKRRTFDTRFKRQVVKKVQEHGLSIKSVCRNLDRVESAVRRWVEQVGTEKTELPGVGKLLATEQPRSRPLETENHPSRQDNDRLKKHRPSWPEN